MSSQRTTTGAPRKDLQERRPPPLKICRDSHQIRKPSLPSMSKRSGPMIIYMQSPKIIHAQVRDFMSLVQRLTGNSSSSYTLSSTAKNENPTADHDSTRRKRAPDVTALSQSAESVDQNMGSSGSDDAPTGLNTASFENDRNQEIESRASGHGATDRTQTAVTSFGDSILIPPFSPLSPNFTFPSPRLFAPTVFKDLPLFSPDSNNFLCRTCEALFSPQRSPLNSSTLMTQSPCPTTSDLRAFPPEY